MSAQTSTVANKPGSDAQVDAYVDALLGDMLGEPAISAPAAASAPATEPAPAPATEPDADAMNAPAPPAETGIEDEPTPELAQSPEAGSVTEAVEAVEAVEHDTATTEVADADTIAALLAEFDAEMATKAESVTAAAPLPAPRPTAPAVEPIANTAPRMPARPQPAAAEPIEPAEDPSPSTTAPSGRRWLRVAVGEDRYAVELLRVQEVVRLAPMIAVRGAAPSLLGVMNLRGRVVPVHDLGRWLRRAAVEIDERARIVVLEHQDELVGMLVTSVTDVVTLEAPHIEPPTPGLRTRIGMGIARTPGAPPTVLLDAQLVFE